MSDDAFARKLRKLASKVRDRADRIGKAADKVENGSLDGYKTWNLALEKDLKSVAGINRKSTEDGE